jgi:uncharacterized protein
MSSSPIEELKKLQDIDSELINARRRQKAGPLEREHAEMKQAEIRKRLEAKDAELNAARVQSDALDLQVKNCDEEIEQLKEKLRQVTNNREYTAARTAIDSANERRSRIETEALEQMEKVETLQKEADALKSEMDEFDQKIGEIDKEISKEARELEDVVSEIRERRQAQKENVDAEALSEYEQALRSNEGVGVVEMINGACQGCFRQLSNNTASKVMGNRELVRCEGCGRFLYAPPSETAGEEDNG